jgi:hypothetical protein
VGNLPDEVQLITAQLRTTLEDPAATMKWSLIVHQAVDALAKAVNAHCDHVFVLPSDPTKAPGSCERGCGLTWEQHEATLAVDPIHLTAVAEARAEMATVLAEARQQGREEGALAPCTCEHAHQRRTEALDDEATLYANRIVELELLVAQQQFDLQAAQTVEAAWRAEADELRAQNRALAAKLENPGSHDELATVKRELAVARDAVVSHQEAYRRISEKYNEVANERNKLAEEARQRDIDHEALGRSHARQGDRVRELLQQVSGLEQQLAEVEADRESIREALKTQLKVGHKQAWINRLLMSHDRSGADHARHAQYMERARDSAAKNAKEWAAQARKWERVAKSTLDQLAYDSTAKWMTGLDPKTQQQFFTELAAVAQMNDLHPLTHLEEVMRVIVRYRGHSSYGPEQLRADFENPVDEEADA